MVRFKMDKKMIIAKPLLCFLAPQFLLRYPFAILGPSYWTLEKSTHMNYFKFCHDSLYFLSHKYFYTGEKSKSCLCRSRGPCMALVRHPCLHLFARKLPYDAAFLLENFCHIPECLWTKSLKCCTFHEGTIII